MILEINKLIDSEFVMLRQVGWILYNCWDQNGGLTKNELDELLCILTVENMEKEYQEGFNDGVYE